METNTLVAFLGLAVAAVSVLIAIGGPLIGFAYKTLSGRITELKGDAQKWVSDEERRRQDAIADITAMVNSNYQQLRIDIAEIKQDIKEIRSNAE